MAKIYVSDVVVDENSEFADFRIWLDEAAAVPVTVRYATDSVTAVAYGRTLPGGSPGDYHSQSGTLNFQPGETVKTVRIKIHDDIIAEYTEQFALKLSDPVNAVLDRATATATIYDDDGFTQAVTVGIPTTLSNFKVPDANSDSLTVQIKISNGNIGGIATGTTSGVKVTTITAGLSLQGSAKDINALLAGATFTAKNVGSAKVDVIVTDGHAGTPVNVSYLLTASNTVPTISGLPTTAQAIQAGIPAALADFVVADADGHALTVLLKASNGNIGGLVVGTTGGVKVTTVTTGLWKLQGSAADINALLADANFTSSTGGPASIAVTVYDDYVNYESQVSATYALTSMRPADANTAPTISGIPTAAQAVRAGTPVMLDDFTVSDADGDALTVILVTSNGWIDRIGVGARATVSEIPGGFRLQGNAADINAGLKSAMFSASTAGPASITITVTDSSIATPVSSVYAFTANGQTQQPQLSVGTSGNDLLQGTPGNDRIDGLGGIDRVLASGSRSAHSLTHNADGSWQLASSAGGSDQLVNVERVLFSDGAIALDLDGNAGAAARLLGLLSKPALLDPGVAGVVLGLVDSLGLEGAARVAVDSGVVAQLAGGGSQQQLLGYLYTQLMGQAPGQAELHALVELAQGLNLDNAQVLATIASMDLTASHVGLVGLAQHGLAFTEFVG